MLTNQNCPCGKSVEVHIEIEIDDFDILHGGPDQWLFGEIKIALNRQKEGYRRLVKSMCQAFPFLASPLLALVLLRFTLPSKIIEQN